MDFLNYDIWCIEEEIESLLSSIQVFRNFQLFESSICIIQEWIILKL